MTVFVITALIVAFAIIIIVNHSKKSNQEIERLNKVITSLEAANTLVNMNYRSSENRLTMKIQENSNLKAKLEALENVNKSLVDEVFDAVKDEDIKVNITGANSRVNIQDVDGKTTVVKKKRGRKPGFKRGPYKKKSTGKPN